MGSSAATQTQPPTWARTVGTAAAVVLGLVLLFAAWAKALDPEAFFEQIRVEGLDFLGLAEFVAYVAIAIEVALGTALVLGIRRKWVLVPTVLLVLFFILLTGRTYWRFEQGLIDGSEVCGCFGNLVSRTPAQAFWQDLLLLGIPAILAFIGLPSGKQVLPKKRLIIVMAATIAMLVLAFRAPELPLDDLATQLHPGVHVNELCAGAEDSPERICLDTVMSEVESGKHWVVLSNLDEVDFLAAVPGMNDFANTAGDVGIWVVTTAEAEVVASFGWTQAPAFQIREAPPALVRPLHRRLPRSFMVEDGVVVETTRALPPIED